MRTKEKLWEKERRNDLMNNNQCITITPAHNSIKILETKFADIFL